MKDYLEVLHQLVNVEKKVVTFAYLSLHYECDANLAKKMLYHFITEANENVDCLYLISGMSKVTKDFRISLIARDQLQEKKNEFNQITGLSVYCVQPCEMKNISPVVNANLEVYSNQNYLYSSSLLKNEFITYSTTKKMPQAEAPGPKPPIRQRKPQETETIEKPKVSESSKLTLNKSKGKTKRPTSFFQRARVREEKEEVEKNASVSIKEAELAATIFSDSDVSDEEQKELERMDVLEGDSEIEESRVALSRNRRDCVKIDSDDEQVERKPEETYVNEKTIKDEKLDEATLVEAPGTISLPIPEKEIKQECENNGERRRKRKKLVKKSHTYQDEDGYLITEDVKVEVTASENEEEEVLLNKKSPKLEEKTLSDNQATKHTPKKPKQKSLLSFFAKK